MAVIRVVAAAMIHHNQVLAARRKSGDWAGYWELPGGKVEVGEADAAALSREISEELGMNIEVGNLLGEFEFQAGGRTINLVVYFARTADREPKHLTDHDQAEWIPLDRLYKLTWAPADEGAVKVLAALGKA